MTNRLPHIPPDQVDKYHKSSFVNEPADPAPAAPAAAPAASQKPARKPAAKAAKRK
jgi:hypothetical protein